MEMSCELTQVRGQTLVRIINIQEVKGGLQKDLRRDGPSNTWSGAQGPIMHCRITPSGFYGTSSHCLHLSPPSFLTLLKDKRAASWSPASATRKIEIRDSTLLFFFMVQGYKAFQAFPVIITSYELMGRFSQNIS